MPSPVTPSRVKALIPSNTGSLCERLSKLFQFPQLFYEDVAYKVTEAGTVTPEYALDFCELDCVGGGTGTPNPNMPAPLNVVATDDAHSDKIVVSWDPVSPPEGIGEVTEYKVYRSPATNVNPNLAVLVGTLTAPTVTFDDPVDDDLTAGTNYIYWVKATNGTDESAFSIPDLGRAASSSLSLPAISDLRSIPGQLPSSVALVWTPPTGATKYDIWRGATNDFTLATKIFADVIPKSTQIAFPGSPQCWNNINEILFYDDSATVGSGQWFYFVVAKKSSPAAVSLESNDCYSWCGDAAPSTWNGTTFELDFTSPSFVVPGGITKIYAIVNGGGAGGAGGSGSYGGGGGGGAATVIEEFTVAPGDTVELVFNPSTQYTTNAPALTDGDDGIEVKLQINAVDKIVCDPGLGGVYSASGGGAGGAGGSGTGDVAPTIFPGIAGTAGSGASGGQSGYNFGARRLPSNLPPSYYGEGGFRGKPGSGGSAYPINPTLAIGGRGGAGAARIYTGA